MGRYLEGRVSAVLGTHTHVGTIDTQMLPQGTAYVTDIGMTGAYDSIIGMVKKTFGTRYRINSNENNAEVETLQI